jgi:hypothetical protein
MTNNWVYFRILSNSIGRDINQQPATKLKVIPVTGRGGP